VLLAHPQGPPSERGAVQRERELRVSLACHVHIGKAQALASGRVHLDGDAQDLASLPEVLRKLFRPDLAGEAQGSAAGLQPSDEEGEGAGVLLLLFRAPLRCCH